MKRVSKGGLKPNLDVDFPRCEPYLSGEMTRLPFPKGQRSTELFAMIHLDVCRPLNVKTHRGIKYLFTFIDER